MLLRGVQWSLGLARAHPPRMPQHSYAATRTCDAARTVSAPGTSDAHACSTSAAAEAAAPTLWQKLLHGGQTGRKRGAACSVDAAAVACLPAAARESRPAHTHAARGRAAAAPRPQRLQGRAASAPGRPQAKAQAAMAGRVGESDLGQGSVVVYQPAAFPEPESAQLFQALQAGSVGWMEREVTVMGRRVLQPRLVAYMADDASLAYTYSRSTMLPEPWSAPVLRIKERVEELAGTTFNSCMLNFYRSGLDHMGYHSDNERLYGSQPIIGSVSFGAPRDFVLRSNADHCVKFSFQLGNGDVLVMKGTTQDHWMHAVPKRKRDPAGRINLTFRTIVHKEDTGRDRV